MDPIGARIGGLGNASGGAEAWFLGLPPVTRAVLTLTFILTLLVTLGFIPAELLILDWQLVASKLHFWRLVTHVLYIGRFSFGWLLHMYMWTQVSGELEQNAVFQQASKGSYLLFILLMAVSVGCLSLLIFWPTGMLIHADAMLFAVVYYWSRRETYTPVSIYFLTVQGYQLPFALMFLHLLMGRNLWLDVVGLISGHAYYFCREIIPAQGGTTLLSRTPKMLDRAVEMISNTPIGRQSSVRYRSSTTEDNSGMSARYRGNHPAEGGDHSTQPFSGRGYVLGGN